MNMIIISVQSYSHMLNNYNVESTDEITAATPNLDLYRNYSVATGDLYGNGTLGVVIGMPYEEALLGKVLLFSWNMTNRENITGEQIGAYFGYSLCVVDVDGDKLDDLIIGAPLYTEHNDGGKYEMGRIYIYHNKYVGLNESYSTRNKVNFCIFPE